MISVCSVIFEVRSDTPWILAFKGLGSFDFFLMMIIRLDLAKQ